MAPSYKQNIAKIGEIHGTDSNGRFTKGTDMTHGVQQLSAHHVHQTLDGGDPCPLGRLNFLACGTNHSKNIAKKGCRELEEGVRKCIVQALGLLPTSQVSLMVNVLGQVYLQSGGQNQKWPTCGQGGYVTPAASGIPSASERGAKSEVAHLWARWLCNPCRLRDPLRFRAGGKIRSGPLVGKVAT